MLRNPQRYSVRQTKTPIYEQKRLHKLFFWLNDRQYDFRDTKGIRDEIASRLDPDWNRQERFIERPGLKLMCLIRGHESEPDHCGIPSHDYCLICGLSTPYQVEANHDV